MNLFDGVRPLSIPSLSFLDGLKLLVIGPHPDDFDAIGVTLRYFKEIGNPIEVGVVRSGSGVEDTYCSSPTLAKKEAIREREQKESIRFFGLPETSLTFLDLEADGEGRLEDNANNMARLKEFIAPTRPDIVFLPHGKDTNHTHQIIYSMFRQVASQFNYACAAFLNRDPKTIKMKVDLYMPFDEKEANWKAELLRFHDSQHQRNLNTRGHGFDDRILNLNRQIAQELSLDTKYAEAFELEWYGMTI